MKRIFLCVSFLIVANFIIFSFAYAADNTGEELKLYVGEPEILSVNNPTRIVISNPNIADVTQATKSEVTLSPKATGTTSLVIWDNFGEQSYRVKVLAEDMRDIKVRIDNILKKLNLPEVYIQAAEEESKILILGSVKTPQDRERITVALGSLKEKIVDLIQVKEEETVVEIDVQVLELNKDATKTLGFTMPSSIAVGETPDRFSKTMRGSLDAIWHVFDWPRNQFTARLDALVQEGKARILSRPRLACQSGKEAELLVGGEKPIFTTSVAEGGETTEVEYKEYGIKLKMKPTVLDKKQIKLALNVEVSDVGTAEFIGQTSNRTAQAYPLTKRTAATELIINDQQTLAIGGLIRQKTEEDISKTAGLGDIPILGLLFRNKTTKMGGGEGERGNTELFITLTPTIIKTREDRTAGSAEPLSGIEKNLPAPLAGYAYLIQKRILENLSYPASAKAASFQGTVKLSLLLSHQGELLEVKVKSSSGHRALDDNAVSVAKGIFYYPPFPASLDQKELWVDVPISYRLD